MNWNEVVVTTTHIASDVVCDMLEELGSSGVVIIDPYDIKEEIEKPNTLDYADDEFLNSLGEDVDIKAYFSEDIAKDELILKIQEKLEFMSQFIDVGKKTIQFNVVNGEDWATSWKKYYKPIRISDRVVIKPSWEEYEPKNDDVVIELEPGMAFGTGQHETTKLCSKFLERFIKKDDKVLDVGTGTGILSIIAKKLGAKEVLAVDIDPVCAKVAKENSEKNNVEISVSCGVLEDVKEGNFDVVVANIIANVIIDFANKLDFYVKKDGYFIASGIIKERKEEVIKAVESNGFKLIECMQDKDWVAMVFCHA